MKPIASIKPILTRKERSRRARFSLISLFSAVSALTTLFPSENAFGFFSEFSPYVGLDYQQIWMNGSGFWQSKLPRSYPGADLYIGGRYCENFGLELGWDWCAKKSRDYTIGTGMAFFNQTASTAHYLNSEVSRSGFHLDLMGFLPIWECLDLIGSAGVGWVYPRVTITDTTTGVTFSDSLLQSAIGSTFARSNAVLRLRLGLSYLLTPCVGVRTLVGWDGSRRLRVDGNQNFGGLGIQGNAFQYSISFAAGAFLNF